MSEFTAVITTRVLLFVFRPEINQKLTKKELINEYTSEIERLKRDLLSTREKSGIFVSKENYVGMETLIQSQKVNIEELEEKINANLYQIHKLNSLFEESQDQLSEKKSKLEEEKALLEVRSNQSELLFDNYN